MLHEKNYRKTHEKNGRKNCVRSYIMKRAREKNRNWWKSSWKWNTKIEDHLLSFCWAAWFSRNKVKHTILTSRNELCHRCWCKEGIGTVKANEEKIREKKIWEKKKPHERYSIHTHREKIPYTNTILCDRDACVFCTKTEIKKNLYKRRNRAQSEKVIFPESHQQQKKQKKKKLKRLHTKKWIRENVEKRNASGLGSYRKKDVHLFVLIYFSWLYVQRQKPRWNE